ncbi:MAG: sensor histidine kinase [Planctomycetota bacterium]
MPIAEDTEIEFEPSPEGIRVSADSAAMRQALLNLMDNSRKYARGGRHLGVQVRKDAERALVRIRDRGPGIHPEERERVFERFVRGERQRTGTVPGLGLYLARRILRDHGGEIVSVACGGPGACFVLELPIANGETR